MEGALKHCLTFALGLGKHLGRKLGVEISAAIDLDIIFSGAIVQKAPRVHGMGCRLELLGLFKVQQNPCPKKLGAFIGQEIGLG